MTPIAPKQSETSDDRELVERLRAVNCCGYAYIFEDAADSIETLAAALADANTRIAAEQWELRLATEKCDSCGARLDSVCPRGSVTPCLREHLGGHRAALTPVTEKEPGR